MKNLLSENLLSDKLEHLKEHLRQLGSVAVAFSGGVDSTFLLKAAHDVLGDRAAAVTVRLHSVPMRELKESEIFCRQEGILQISCELDELQIEGFSRNPENRCYICKKEIFREIQRQANTYGLQYIIEGSNTDDLGDYRPGLSALREIGAISPLQDAKLSKQEIRELSRRLGLSTWEKPSFACLSSRIPYGEMITEEKLRMAEQGEQLLMDLGFRQMRVRIHGKSARIELLPEEFERIIQKKTRDHVLQQFRSIGFQYISLDLQGYRTGSMNEILSEQDRSKQNNKQPDSNGQNKNEPNRSGSD